jgi:aminoglycoside phosphotransferase (APT) family kinase protein
MMLSKSFQELTDPKNSTYPQVLDPEELRIQLRWILPSNWGQLQNLQIRVVRNHEGKRCTVEIALRMAIGWRHLIGKIYAKDRSDIYQTMEGITQVGFAPDAQFSIPKPLAYVPALHLLLYEKVQGTRADEVFVINNEHERSRAANRCAQWLARFQAAAPQPKRVITLTDYLGSMDRWSRLIAEDDSLAGKARNLFEQLKAATPEQDSNGMCASHGDFGTRNVVFVDGCTIVYDWDSCKLANPCRDVASFLVDFNRLALHRLGSIRALDNAAKEFLRTYRTLGRSEALSYLPFYRAARCLEVANIIFRKQKLRWRENVEAMLDEGFCALKR